MMNSTLSARTRILGFLALVGTLAVLAQATVSARVVDGPAATALVIDAEGATIGVAGLSTTDAGTRILIAITGLAPGKHGVHIHANGSCEDSTNDKGETVTFGGAGSHFDPHETGHHGGPETSSDEGHAGDLPNIEVGEDGRGILDVTTDKVSLEEGPVSVMGRSIIIHANEDNYTDEPALGGSGPRVACGIIQPLADVQE